VPAGTITPARALPCARAGTIGVSNFCWLDLPISGGCGRSASLHARPSIPIRAATGWRREEVIGRTEAELEIWANGVAPANACTEG